MLAIFIFTLHITNAQTLSLQQALQQARANSPEVHKAQSAHSAAEWRKVDADSGFYPAISVGADHLLDKKYVLTDVAFNGQNISFPGIIPSTSYSLNAEWNLFSGFADVNRARAARAFETATRDELDWTEFRITREVTLQFYRALAARTLQTVAESNLNTLKDHLRDITLFRRTGLSTNYDVLRVEVQVSEAESELLNAQDNAELSKGKLSELLGSEQAATPQGQLPELRADLVEQARTQGARADLAALSERVQGLEFEQSASGRHWLPQLALYGNYLYYNNRNDDYDDWSNFRNAYQVGLRLRWSLFDGFHSTARHHVSVAEKAQAESTLRAQQLKAQQDLNMWVRKFKYFSSVYKARQSDVGKAKESVRLAREGRKAGARTNTDLLDAEAELYRAQAGQVTAQLGAIEALIQVELASGRPLYSFE